jgi:V/A-type H+-transporting ATPase subunit I
MSMRATSAKWFHIVVPANAFEHAAEILAGSSLVELDSGPSDAQAPAGSTELVPDLVKCQEICRRYHDVLPAPHLPPHTHSGKPVKLLAHALKNLIRWEQLSGTYRQRLKQLGDDIEELHLWREFVDACRAKNMALSFQSMTPADGHLRGALLVLPADAEPPDYPERLVVYRIRSETHTFLLVVGTRDAGQELDHLLEGRTIRKLFPPAWLVDDPTQALTLIDSHLKASETELYKQQASLDVINRKLAIPAALGIVERIGWSVENLSGARLSEYLAHIYGWTSDTTGDRLIGLLLDAGIPAAIAYPSAPADKIPPTLSSNPAWARPFELFVRFLGVPGQYEADPSRLLTFIAPLLFGYMFGDLGQGAVMLVLGIVLRRRWPPLALLIPGGLAAMLFGLLFGSVFSLEHVVPPLWVSPMGSPLTVLFVPIAGGAVLILLSLLLSGMRAFWSQRLPTWLRTDAGLVLLYCGALLFPLWSRIALIMVGVALVWCVTGHILQSLRRGVGAAVSGLVELIERIFQLGVNTLSFVRVGAFALAHAGLSLAVVSLAQTLQASWLMVVVLVVGNILILGLEGLVVFVQTTRLILFEFFTRFLQAEGRQFHPSSPPTTVH